MFDKSSLKGIFPPTFLPLNPDWTIDYVAFEKTMKRYLDAGVNGVLLLGTCGEGAIVDSKTRIDAVRFCKKALENRIPLMVGVIETSLPRAIAAVEECAQAGADFALVTPPCYFANNNQEEIVRFYQLLAKNAPIPLLCYNIPSHTGVVIQPGTFIEIAKIDGMVGFKNSTDDWANIQRIMLLKHETKVDFAFFMGNEEYFPLGMMLGIDGAISGGAAIFPEYLVEMYKKFSEDASLDLWKNHPEVTDYMMRMHSFSKLPSVTGTPKKSWLSSYKAAYAYNFGVGDTIMPPMDQLNESEKQGIAAIVDKINDR